MPVDEDAEAGAGATAGLLGQLQGDAIGGDHIVAADAQPPGIRRETRR
jgi:hypothetical protein